jgi:hypothetical protein
MILPDPKPAPRGAFDWLFGAPEKPHPPARGRLIPAMVRLETIGREHSGKTANKVCFYKGPLQGAQASGLGAVLLAGYLATAEQHCRERDPARAGVYVLALRGLSRFLAEPEGGSIMRERLLAGATASADHRLPAWIGRFFGWITGAPGDNGPR